MCQVVSDGVMNERYDVIGSKSQLGNSGHEEKR